MAVIVCVPAVRLLVVNVAAALNGTTLNVVQVQEVVMPVEESKENSGGWAGGRTGVRVLLIYTGSDIRLLKEDEAVPGRLELVRVITIALEPPADEVLRPGRRRHALRNEPQRAIRPESRCVGAAVGDPAPSSRR